MDDKGKKFIVGIFEDEDVLLDAITKVRDKGVNIYEVYSPFPVHGIENRLGYKRSRLSIAAFCFGFLGTCLALTMMIGMMTIDWPMIIGGKDFLPLPVFIPVTFEMTVFFAAHLMVITFLMRCGLYPGSSSKSPDPRTTDDKFLMEIHTDGDAKSIKKIKDLMKKTGAEEVNEKTE